LGSQKARSATKFSGERRVDCEITEPGAAGPAEEDLSVRYFGAEGYATSRCPSRLICFCIRMLSPSARTRWSRRSLTQSAHKKLYALSNLRIFRWCLPIRATRPDHPHRWHTPSRTFAFFVQWKFPWSMASITLPPLGNAHLLITFLLSADPGKTLGVEGPQQLSRRCDSAHAVRGPPGRPDLDLDLDLDLGLRPRLQATGPRW